MTGVAPRPEDTRTEGARLAFALIRFAGAAAHPGIGETPPGMPRIGIDAYIFTPSWRRVPSDEVEPFLVGLPSPALLSPTLERGVIALTLLHELSGERRRWGEKTIGNFVAILDELSTGLGLSGTSRILLEFDDESHVFPLAAVREWAQQFAVNVGWSIGPLDGDEHADACLMLLRNDGKAFPGRSCMGRGLLRGRGAGPGESDGP